MEEEAVKLWAQVLQVVLMYPMACLVGLVVGLTSVLELSVLDLGISKVEATGEVFNLVEAKDLAGTFVAGGAGAALVGGGSVVAMKNRNGVVMQLKSQQKGVRLTLAGGGLNVELVD